MAESICVYRIKKAPYLAVSSIYKKGRKKCVIEDTKGKKKRVNPLYIGPFDADKICMFGALTSKYYQKDSEIKEETIFKKTCELFNIDPNKAGEM